MSVGYFPVVADVASDECCSPQRGFVLALPFFGAVQAGFPVLWWEPVGVAVAFVEDFAFSAVALDDESVFDVQCWWVDHRFPFTSVWRIPAAMAMVLVIA
ncbi:hypothetical protein [Corynebacterium sp. H113]|uniref:hypothetical protein n=1 Tax=Corynebacterium sp. H113 TaxID=3133419 RepID=UPI0030A0BE33